MNLRVNHHLQIQFLIHPLLSTITKSPQTASKELRVYARRKRPEREIEHSTPLAHVQEPVLSPKPVQIHSGKETPTLEIENEVITTNDCDMPITLIKGVRTCTQHLIYNFVSYGKLSPSYQAFVSALNSVQVPNSIQEALKNP